MSAGLNVRHDFRSDRIRTQGMTRSERFWLKVQKSEGCWLWLGGRNARSYGIFGFIKDGRQRSIAAHRFAYMDSVGPVPDDLHVCHHCDNPPCVRPDHLFVGTRSDNMRDAQRKGRMRVAQLRVLKGRRHGIGHPHVKLTEQSVRDIRVEYAAGLGSMSDLSRIYGVDIAHIHRIIHRKVWRHVA